MKKINYKILILFVLQSCCLVADDYNPFGVEIESGTAYMIDVHSGRVLYAKNPNQMIYPASTTKLATALLSYHKLQHRLDEKVIIQRDMVCAVSTDKKVASHYKLPAHWLEFGSTHMGLKVGEEMSVEHLLQGCLIVSGNDASNALAITSSGSYDKFIQELNALMNQLGCKQTHFVNAHGLFNPQHTSSTYDLVQIAKEFIKYPFLTKIASQLAFLRPKTNKQEPVTMQNTNFFLHKGKNYYPAVCGLKKGYTTQSGASFVIHAKNDHREVLLALSANPKMQNIFYEAKKLLDCALNEVKQERFFYAAGDKIIKNRQISGAQGRLEAVVKNDVKVKTFPSEEKALKGVITWLELVPPIKKGHYVGKLEICTEDGLVISTTALLAAQDLEPTLFFRLAHFFHLFPLISTAIAGLTLVMILLALFRMRRL